MTQCERCEILEFEIAELKRALFSEPTPKQWGFTPTQDRLFRLLRTDKLKSMDQLYTAMYAHRVNPPEPKIIEVYICYIRKKLKTANAPFCVVTDKGVGWKLEAVT